MTASERLNHIEGALGESEPCKDAEQRALRDRIRLLEAVVSNFPGGISLFDSGLRMVFCNDRQKALLEYGEAIMIEERPTLEQLFRYNAARGEYGEGDVETHVRRRLDLVHKRVPHCYDRTRPNGMIVEVRGLPIEGGGFVTTYLDVTEQRHNQELVAHMAYHDALTDLPNRLLLNDRLSTAIALSRRIGQLALHFLDLDNFKQINDRLGHQAGDALLIQAAVRMREWVRESDTIARLGGDEFAIVQTNIQEANDAAILANRIIGVLSGPFEIAGEHVLIGVSIGIALAILREEIQSSRRFPITSSSPDKEKFVSAFRADFARVVDILANTSQAMRCAREAKRPTQLSDQELFGLGVKRVDIVQHSFRGCLGH